MKRIPNEVMIHALKDAAAELGHPPGKDWWEKSKRSPCNNAIRKRFGTWNDAIRAAGMEPMKERHVTREMMLDDIERVTKELGRSPNMTEYKKLGKYTNFANLGGWRGMMDELGYRWQNRTRKIDLLRAVVDVADDIGRTPLYIEFTKHPAGFSSGVVYKFFDSYDDLLGEAGLDVPERSGGWRGLSGETLIDKLHEFVSENGYVPDIYEYQEFSGISASMSQYYFDGYADMVTAAGYEPRVPMFTQKSIKTLDGHIVQSSFELMIDNFLFRNDIQHEVQVDVCDGRRWTCDFVLLGEIWLEADGLEDARPNKKPHKEKLNFYRDNRYNYLIIGKSTRNWQDIILERVSEIQ